MPTKSGIIWQGGQTVLNLNGADESLTFKKGLIPSSGNFTVSVIFRAGTFSSGPTIYQGNQIFEMNLSPALPSNLDIFNGDGAASGAMLILAAITAPAIAAGVGATGSGPSVWLTPESAQRIGKLTFGPTGVSAGVRSAVDFHLLQRDDGRVDFVIKTHNAYHTAYSQNTNDDRMFRSLFQDQMIVRIAPQPANTPDLSICDNVCFPLTNNDKAT